MRLLKSVKIFWISFNEVTKKIDSFAPASTMMEQPTTLNTSHANTTTSAPLVQQETYPIIFWTFLAIETIITIFGNVLLCLVFVTNKKLRTGQNYFVVSLSIGDLLGGLMVIPCEYCRMERNKGDELVPFYPL